MGGVVAEGIDGGGIFVSVSPEAKGFWAQFEAQTRAGANRAGDDLGDRIGKAISQRIARSIREGVTAGGAGLGAQGARAGEEYGGRFATTLRARLDAALRNLPTPTIGASTTEAEQKVRDLRDSLDRLRNQTVGVDISDADALAELRRIQDELRRLSRDGATVAVRADAGAAAAELAAVRREVDRLDGRNANINVDTNADQAARGMQLLVSAGLAIDPAIVPGAAAAAAAILFIGSAATSVAAGVGVGALAFHGVSDAIKALDTAQQQSAKSGATLAKQQKSLASSADQVRSAEAGLANARANAGDAARRSGQQVADAERAVTAAQQDAVRAQRSLNEAREKEIADRQDLAQQLKGNALDREQAALDVAAARAKLARSNAEQDRIDFDQAVLRQQNLEIAGKRLAAQQVENTKVGVDGARQVRAAQDGLAQAQQKVVDAERSVGEARAQAASQARQSAAAIASASQAVVTAQRNVGAATVAAGATGGAAMDALAAAMDGLPVSGQNFARFLFGLKGDLSELQKVAADGILPGAQQSIQILLPYFGNLRSFVGGVASEIGSLEVRAAHTFTSPFWRQFFGFIAGEAVPNMELLYRAGINVAESGARIVQGFAPVEREVGGGLLTLTQRFLAFSQGLEQNQGFQDFVRFAQAEVPHVIATVIELAKAGARITEAYGPVGSVVVSGLQILGQVINALPVSVITALATAVTGYKTATLLTSGVQSLLNSNLLVGIGRMVTYKTVTDAAGVTTTGFQRAASSVSSFVGGPLLVALTVAGVAIAYFASKSAEASANTEQLKSGLGDFASNFKDGITPAALDSAKAIFTNNEQLRGFIDEAKRAGASQQDIVAGLNGDAAARDRVVAKLDAQIESSNKASIAYAKLGAGQQQNANAASDHADNLEKLRKAYVAQTDSVDEATKLTSAFTGSQVDLNAALQVTRKVFDDASSNAEDYGAALTSINSITDDAALKAGALSLVADKVASSNAGAADKAKLFGGVLAGLGAAASDSGPVFSGLAETFNAIASASLDATDKSRLLKQSLDQMYGSAISQNEADETLVDTQSRLNQQMQTSTAGFVVNTSKGVENTRAVRANQEALEAAAVALRAKYVQDIVNLGSEEAARAAYDKNREALLNTIPAAQRTSAAVTKLVEDYGGIPPKKSTEVTTPGLAEAIDKLAEAHAVQYGLDQHPVWTNDQIASYADFLKKKINGASSIAVSKATGGPVFGPGTATSDSIPAMLSNDEHVLTAAEVKAAGGHQNVYALRSTILRGGLKGILPGFAAGGAVSSKWPINIPTSLNADALLANLRQQLEVARAAESGDVGGADLGIARTIAAVAAGLKADHKVLLSAMETALVESGMHNLQYGDRDSLGVFQQRPSQGWGSAAEILNVAHAARSYLTRAIANEPRYATAGQLAQSVQRSAFPARYDQRSGDAEAIIDALSPGSAGIGVGSAGQEQIKAFLRSTDPLPYVFGAAGPKSYDCSGLASAVVGKITGRGGGGGQRYFTTFDFANGAPAGFKPGAGGTLTVGVNPTEHMAGNYGGLGFEAASVKTGIKIGASARKPNTFQKQFHMAQGGAITLDLLEKLGLDIGGDAGGLTVNGRKIDRNLFDSGGVVPQGLSLMDNRTRGPELAAVMTSDQLPRLSPGSGDRGLVHIDNFNPPPDMSAHAIAAELDWRLRGHGG